jgi:hypothetical protein
LTSSSLASKDANTARTYALIGLIFYVINAVVTLMGIGFFRLLARFQIDGAIGLPVFRLTLILILLVVEIITIGLTVWAWFTFRNIGAGLYTQARTPSIILGILGLFFAGLIGGIFFILTYTKLGDVVEPRATIVSSSQRFCVSCGRAVVADAKFCSHCGKELPP